MHRGWTLGTALALAFTCGCGDDDSSGGGASTGVAGSGGSGAQGGTAGSGGSGAQAGTGGTGGTGATGGTGGGYQYQPPDLQGQVFIGHYLGNYDLYGFEAASLSPSGGSPLAVGVPNGDVLGISKHGVVAITYEGGDSIEVYDAATLIPIIGSPFSTGYGPVALVHDDARDHLYIYCIGTIGDPTESLVTIYDTNAVPWTELPGSPFAIDVAAVEVDFDPVTATLYGITLSAIWAARLEGGAMSHLPSSPITIAAGSGADLAVDPTRRRLYYTERFVAADQQLHALDLDTFTPIAASPLSVPGSAAGDVAVHLATGDVYFVDFGDSKLHSAAAEPFALRNTCGQNGCDIPWTETGIAIDHELDRLFLPHLPDLINPDALPGFLSAWDISDPAAPSEITTPQTRPALGYYANRASVH